MKPINIINKLNESVQPLDKEKYFNLMDAVDELIVSVNGNKAQLQDVLKDVTEMFNKALDSGKEDSKECFACGRPAGDNIDDLGKPVCPECLDYIYTLVDHGEWIENEYGEKANYKDFEEFDPDYSNSFKTLDFNSIPFDKLTDEAYNIYLKEVQ